MTDTMKIRLINAYANLLDSFGRNNKALSENMRYCNGSRIDYHNICATIDHLGNEIQKIKF